MSKRLDVLKAVKALIQGALPGATVLGLDEDAAKPTVMSPLGQVIVRQTDPGDPEIYMSPLTYYYQHPIVVQIDAYQSATVTNAEALDDMMVAIGTAIEADRTLGGLCDWVEPEMPGVDDYTTRGSEVAAGADLTIVATYSTPNPLT